MRKAQTSLGGILILVISITLMISFMFQDYYPLELEKDAYTKQYHQMILKNMLNYRNAEDVSVKELLNTQACGKNTNVQKTISEILDKTVKHNNQPLITINQETSLKNAARIILQTHCGEEVTIIVGTLH